MYDNDNLLKEYILTSTQFTTSLFNRAWQQTEPFGRKDYMSIAGWHFIIYFYLSRNMCSIAFKNNNHNNGDNKGDDDDDDGYNIAVAKSWHYRGDKSGSVNAKHMRFHAQTFWR